ncbi:ABC transporter ATP-binding protein [Brachybacterium sp. EF45031]|uniref:ABC transporter transmembrane domain-containing protein n=1 Tax=Brachybacterium sillae TaxID=2810536 RepID=UPI00217CE93D|nr:ABC transporter transmembrane domain-containing protein [Brachybacterium sillae]MCS6711590.1 ABC transporter ATP-binding protein [Brachybacterium sillae]
MPTADRPGPLPPLLRGPRTAWLAILVLLGLLQAAVAGVSAWALVRMQAAPAGVSDLFLRAAAVLVLAAVALGALTVQQRVLAERLGQHYVHELRGRLLRDALTPGATTSLGVTVARTTNDLSSVRGWVSQGIAPLAVGIPLVAGSAVALALLDPALAGVFAAPLALLAVLLAVWSRVMFQRTRELRRQRGRLAARIGDTVSAAPTILASGGTHRELRGMDRASADVVEHAVERAGAAGALQAAGTTVSSLSTLAVAAAGVFLALPASTTVAAMAIAGLAAAPVLELGRIIERRETFRAARAVLGPALEDAEEARARAREHERASAEVSAPREQEHALTQGRRHGPVHLELPGLTDRHGPVRGLPGMIVRLTGPVPTEASRLLDRVVGRTSDPEQNPDSVWVAGHNLRALGWRARRELVGHAAAGAVIERGPLLRALRYRRPEGEEEQAVALFQRLGGDLSRLPKGLRTRLRSGGEPLSRPDRARLLLTRALDGTPPLLLLDGIDADLDPEGRQALVRELRAYPGVVVMTCGDELAQAVGAVDHPVESGAGGAAD